MVCKILSPKELGLKILKTQELRAYAARHRIPL